MEVPSSALAREMATRSSWDLILHFLDDMEKEIPRRLVMCKSDDERLQVQARAQVIHDIRVHLKGHQKQLEREKPIVIST